MKLEKALSEYLKWRKNVGADYISTHEFEHARDWIKEKYNKVHTVGTIDREWRRLRSKGVVEVKSATVPGKREKTWKIIEFYNPERNATLRLR